MFLEINFHTYYRSGSNSKKKELEKDLNSDVRKFERRTDNNKREITSDLRFESVNQLWCACHQVEADSVLLPLAAAILISSPSFECVLA
jgi:hypothetical protein